MIPKLSDPLKAGIRTTEFWLMTTVGAVIAVYSSIDPSKLPPKTAAIIIGAKASIYTVSRAITKGLGAFNGLFQLEEPEPAIEVPESARTPDGAAAAEPGA